MGPHDAAGSPGQVTETSQTKHSMKKPAAGAGGPGGQRPRPRMPAAGSKNLGLFGYDAGCLIMAEQRMRVEQLANRLGRGLTGVVERDLDTLQRILDDRMVPTEDTLTLQAMGVVFGDLLGERLDMDWVVYRDNKGRSRALRYRQMDVYLFPVTMISRRQEGGSGRRLKPLFDDTVRDTRLLLPGGKWFQ